jgi:hypothetical protein
MRTRIATGVEVFTARLHVVEVRHDRRACGERGPRVVKLPRQRQGRVLLVLGGDSTPPRDAQPDPVGARRRHLSRRARTGNGVAEWIDHAADGG